MPIKIPFDSLSLCASARELDSLLTGGIIQRVTQPVPTDLIITVRHRGANHSLLLSCDAVYARAHLTVVKRQNPPSAPTFCMACRKYVEGARVTGVKQRGFDRILDITVEGPEGVVKLVAELMGKHSNLILLNHGGYVLESAKRIGYQTSRFRQILPGLQYLPPPLPEGKNNPLLVSPLELPGGSSTFPVDKEELHGWFIEQYSGLSPFLADELVRRVEPGDDLPGGIQAAWESIFGAAKRGAWQPMKIKDDSTRSIGAYPFPTAQLPEVCQQACESFQIALDQHYAIAIPQASLNSGIREIAGQIRRALKGREREKEELARGVARSERADEMKEAGELILANLHKYIAGEEALHVVDYYREDAPERDIPLDPLLSGQQNAESYFRKYRKARDGAVTRRERFQRVKGEIAGLIEMLQQIDQMQNLEEFAILHEKLKASGFLRAEQTITVNGPASQQRPTFEGKKIRSAVTPEGYEILWGENSEANDFLTGRVAASNDIWLHVRSNTSAHVIIRTHNRPDSVPLEIIQRAAEIAAKHSAAKHSLLVPVDWTLKKHVRRPRHAPSGTVTYSNEKTIYVG